MKVNLLKKLSVLFIALPLVAAAVLNSMSVQTTRAAGDEQQDMAALYTTNKCAVCHGAKAEKKFDASKSDEALTEAIMKGVKGEKPPFMPAFESKGITQDQAKALTAYMKSLKQ